MDASMGKDIPGPKPPEIIRQEQLRHWLETGFNQQAVAAYGTSLPTFIKILESGSIPPNPNEETLDYQTEFRKSGNLLYYFNVLGENLQRINPNFYNQLVENTKRFGATKRKLTVKNGHQVAKIYARNHAIAEEVSSILGIPPAEAKSLPVEGSLYDYDLLKLLGLDHAARQFRDQLLSRNVDIEKLKEKLNQKRGAIIYFNGSIFDGSTFFPGEEDADEFVLARNLPLGFHTVSGIEIPGKEERKELEEKYAI